MLRKRHHPQIDMRPPQPAQGFEHLTGESIAVLAWLQANQVEFVLVGPVAETIRGGGDSAGPVAIVPAPYRRNFERLSRALDASGAKPRGGAGAEAARAKAAADKVVGGQRWEFRTHVHFLDVEGRTSQTPGYQELLYEAGRFELAAGLNVDVASPEDIEHFAHVRRTGTSPEVRITRGVQHVEI
ncbi:MAG: hypothetical protein JO325_06170 [Solirubrobacterales bacterium]|nr:hypothetical protein [Solirubrobacterales bacterium]